MDSKSLNEAPVRVVHAVRQLFEAAVKTLAAKDTARSDQLVRVLSLMAELRPDPESGEPRRLPGCRHVERALDLAESGGAAAVAAAIRPLLPTLTWHQNPRYNAGNMGAVFMEGLSRPDR